MNIIEKINEKDYLLTLEDGSTYPCKTWIEKKTKNGEPVEYEHVIIPKEIREICGRTYIRTSLVNPRYKFENKTTHREGLGNGGWRARMTEEEKAEYESLERRMNEIKETCMNREISEEEKLKRQIEKLEREKAKMMEYLKSLRG